MLSQSIRWRSTSPRSHFRVRKYPRCATLLLLTGLALGTNASLAADDTPDIEPLNDPLLAEFSQAFDQRLLNNEAPYSVDERGFVEVYGDDDRLPEPFIVQPGGALDDMATVIDAQPPAADSNEAPEWILYPETQVAPTAEDALFERINREYAAAERSVEGPVMDLPPWPDTPGSQRPSFEVFEAQLISPFDPIPELNTLPFPDA